MSDKAYNITKHARERYAERILNKKDKLEINRYVAENYDKIDKDILKMIVYGTCIYTGKNPRKDKLGGTTQLSIYTTGAWIILVNPDKLDVITLFKIDLGFDDEFNSMYVDKLMKKFADSQIKVEETKEKVLIENEEIRKNMSENNDKIATYREYIKKLEEANNGYKAIMDANLIKVSEAEEELNAVLEKIVTKQ